MKKNKKKGFIKDSYNRSFNLIKRSGIYIFGAFLVIFFTSVIGYIFPGIFEAEILKIIKEILNQLEGKTTTELIIYIFFNNLKASLFAMIFGIVLGIFPIIFGILNGYVIGFTSHLSVEKAGPLILWRLLPHGIFEIPAILLSMGIGFYLGSRFIEKIFRIKNEIKRIIIVFTACVISVPFFFFYYIFVTKFSEQAIVSVANLTGTGLILFAIISVLNLLILFLMGFIFYIFIRNKELKKDFYDSLLFFVFIVIPLLIIAAIIEGVLVGVLG